jgi:drug/metabolite transporter (DMT)-like permease
MFFAIITVFLFAGSALCGRQAAMRSGSLEANFFRLVIATIALGIICLLAYPENFSWPVFWWLSLSGFIGFGIGDVALYMALARIGSRLTLLLNFCLATMFAIIGDWLWLGDALTTREALAIGIILTGLVIALLGKKATGMERHGSYSTGVIAGVIAAFGQGFGSTISRHAQAVAKEIGTPSSGISEAFQRVIPGMLVGAIALYVVRHRRKTLIKPSRALLRHKALPWMFAAAMFGPVIGVSCFQTALATTSQSGIVLAIVSTSPLILIPLGAIFEKDKPTLQTVLGAIIATSAVIWLCLG